MMLGAIVKQNGTTEDSPTLKHLRDIRCYCLFAIRRTDELKFGSRMQELMQKAMAALELTEPYYFIYRADGLTNVLTICPPIIEAGTGAVIFSNDPYEKAIRDDQWPTVLIVANPITALEALAPLKRKTIEGKLIDETPASPLVS